MRSAFTVPVFSMLVLALDVITKHWALAHLKAGMVVPFLPGLLQFTLVTNTGGAFGIGRQYGQLMTLLPVSICVVIILWLSKRELEGGSVPLVEQIGFALILGGALGNICDRLIQGRVTDFIEFAFMNFPVFNVADALIDTGVGLILLKHLQSSGNEKGVKGARAGYSGQAPVEEAAEGGGAGYVPCDEPSSGPGRSNALPGENDER